MKMSKYGQTTAALFLYAPFFMPFFAPSIRFSFHFNDFAGKNLFPQVIFWRLL